MMDEIFCPKKYTKKKSVHGLTFFDVIVGVGGIELKSIVLHYTYLCLFFFTAR